MSSRTITASNVNNVRNASLQKRMNEVMQHKYLYLLLLPGMIFFLIFKYVPMYGIVLAFKNYKAGLGVLGSPWIGLENFSRLFSEKDFYVAFVNTLIISAMKIVFGFPLPIILALLLNEIRVNKLKKTLQVVYTFPHFLSWVVLSGICINLLSSSGAVNNLLCVMGLERVDFLTNRGGFRYLLTFTEIWKESGWATIIYLAGIAGIDLSLYEAATVDGANRLDKMIHITWPSIKNMTIVLLVLSLGNVMEAGFMQVLNLYNAAVYDVADILDTYVYRITFQQASDFGFSTAVGLFKGVANLVLLITANAIAKMFGNSGIV